MPKTNRFKQALARGLPQIGMWSTLASPYVAELLAGAGYDWILLDTEHSPSDPVAVLGQLQGVDAEPGQPTSAVVRAAWNDAVLIKRFLDIGSQSLLLPFVQNAEEARAAVAATRYPPQGIRGLGGSTRSSRFGRDADHVASANGEMCVLVQVETADALEQLEAIAAVDGVDGIFIGPADLSASLGYPGNPAHPVARATIDRAIQRVAACGKAPGIIMVDPVRARECLDLGALFVAVAVDQILLRRAADELARFFKSGGVADTAGNGY